MWIRWLSAALCALSPRGALRLGRVVGWLWYWVVPIRRRTARRNVARALPELDARTRRRVVRQSFTHMALYGVEALRAPLWTAARSDERVERAGFEHLEAALARGTGAVVFMAHTGSLDVAGFSQAARGLPITVVVKTLGSRAADAFIQTVRARTGLELLPTRGSRQRCLQALRDNRILTVVVDQHMPAHRGIPATFFGHLASTTPVAVELALDTGAPLHGALAVRRDLADRHLVRIEPELVLEQPYTERDANVAHNVERMNRVVEGWVRAYPEQYLWMHRRWKLTGAPTNRRSR